MRTRDRWNRGAKYSQGACNTSERLLVGNWVHQNINSLISAELEMYMNTLLYFRKLRQIVAHNRINSNRNPNFWVCKVFDKELRRVALRTITKWAINSYENRIHTYKCQALRSRAVGKLRCGEESLFTGSLSPPYLSTFTGGGEWSCHCLSPIML